MANRNVLHEFRPTWAAWFWSLVLTMGIALPWVWWRRRGVRYEVTDERVIRHTGRLSTATDEFALEDVSRIRTCRSVGEKLLGGGTVVIDTGIDEMVISAVPEYEAVVSTLRKRT
jgi:uncharacterized membrane protein YdbT with pleckstrin-like domain